MRAFVAILLTEEVRARLADEAARLRHVARDVAWVAPENVHLTVKFLGAIDDSRVSPVAAALATAVAGLRPFTLALRGLGAFPSPTRARVIWAGAAEGAEAAATLAGRVDAALAALGFPREARPFACHVTLGRVRAPARNPGLADALAAAATRAVSAVTVDRVSLMQSHLSPRGARYTELAAVALG